MSAAELHANQAPARLSADASRADSGVAGDLSQLHPLLVRAARFEIERRRTELGPLEAGQLDALAREAADAAAVAVRARLGDYLGHSRFSTWAAKFAIREAAVRARRRAWAGRDFRGAVRTSRRLAGAASLADGLRNAALVSAIRARSADILFDEERELLCAIALGGVPIDVVAGRLGTSRGELYRRLQEVRRALRRPLGAPWCAHGRGSEPESGGPRR